MAGIIEKRYAEALYKIASENNKIDTVLKETFFVKDVLQKEVDFMKVLCHPEVDQENKLSMVKNVFGGKVSGEVVGLIVLAIKKDRQASLNKIFEDYNEIVKVKKNIATAVVTSAIELSHEHAHRIYETLKQNLNKEIELKLSVDTDVIGGLKIQVNNTVFDRTIKTKIENLRKAL